jgi:hypothetical protein
MFALHAVSLHAARSAAEAGPRVQFGWTVVLKCLVAWLFFKMGLVVSDLHVVGPGNASAAAASAACCGSCLLKEAAAATGAANLSSQ